MPLYLYECRACKSQQEMVHGIDKLQEKRNCACGGELFRVICTTNIQMDYEGYQCPVSGDWIEGRAAHKANLKKHGCRVLEKGEQAAAVKGRLEQEKALERKIDEDLGRTIQALPRAKRQQLRDEVSSGNLDIAVERQ